MKTGVQKFLADNPTYKSQHEQISSLSALTFVTGEHSVNLSHPEEDPDLGSVKRKPDLESKAWRNIVN